MKSNLVRKIFDESQVPVTRSELDQALEEKNTPNVLLEKKMMQSDLEHDALIGYNHLKLNTASMDKLDIQMQMYLSNPKKISNSINRLIMFWFMGFFGILILAISLQKNINVKTTESTSLGLSVGVEKTQKTESQEETNGLLQEKERFIVTKTPQVFKPDTKKEESVTESTQNQAIPKRMNDNYSVVLENRVKPTGIKKPFLKEIALSDFIFVDYRGLRQESNFNNIFEQGTPANIPNSKVETFEDKESNVKMGYHSYLKETATYLNGKFWERALQQFQTILKHYPDDLNALFDSGYLYFQMKEYSKSLYYLDLCAKSYYGNFEEEKNWYKLKCLLEMGLTDQAKKIAEEIFEFDGFYKNQAEEIRKKLNQ